jgi:hypothetical protein
MTRALTLTLGLVAALGVIRRAVGRSLWPGSAPTVARVV